MPRLLLLLPLLVLSLLSGLGQANPLRVDQWDKKLPGTYWYVPMAGLPATFHDATVAQSLPIEQQTVYYISSCVNGVFNGWLVNEWSGAIVPTLSKTCSTITGTIDPKGNIAMVISSNGVWSTPWPKATVMRKGGKLRTLVQASISVSSTSFVVHGPTYMTVITPKDKEWADLPGNPGSLPDFVSFCGHVV